MSAFRNGMVALFTAFALLTSSSSLLAAPGYLFVEGYNVLDDANSPGIGALFAATAGQERDIAVDSTRGIIYMARGSTTTGDRAGGVAGVAAIVVTNGALAGSNFRDTGLLINNGGVAISFQQSIAFDVGSDKLWVLGGGAVSTPTIYSATGGSLGGAPNGGNPAAVNTALTPAFRVDTNLLEVGVYVPGTNGLPARGGSPRGLAVRTANGVTTVYVGMGNHVQAWSNDQPTGNTNSPWRRIWATLRPPAGNLTSTRVIPTFSGVNGLAVDDDGNCFFSVQQAGGRIWCVRPDLIAPVSDKMSLEYNDLAFGGNSEREIVTLIIAAGSFLSTPPQGLTFARFNNQKSLFASFGTTSRGVTRLDITDGLSFSNSGAYIAAQAIDGFGTGQPAGGQDTILSGLRLKQAAAGQPQGASTGLLYTDVDSITNPTYLYVVGFVTDTNKGQTIPTAAVIKVRIPADTNPPSITTQPQSQTLLEGGTIGGITTAGTFPLSVTAAGATPLYHQWQSNGVNIAGATGNPLTIPNATTNQSGGYRVIVTNALGSTTSMVATVTINPLVRSLAMTHLWSNAPGSRPYLTTDNTQRGITYNPTTFSVLIVSRTPATGVYVLDSESGADLYQLGLGAVVTGGTLPLNKISSADDGQIYAANVAQNGENFRIYRWPVEEANMPAQLAFSGNPTPGATNRWGDTFDVRGSGSGIQILAGTRDSNVVAIFTTADDGQTFSSTPITVADALGANFGLGLAFGAGNTFWAKGDGSGPLRQVQFDLGTGTGTTLHSYPAPSYPSSGLAIAIETNLNLLASISIENPDNLRLYTTYNLANPPVLIDQELFPTDNENAFGTGALDFGGGKLFAIDSNNGILAVTLGTIAPPPPAPGSITIVRNGPTVELSWSGLFTLQASTNVVGPYVDITSPTNSFSENTAGQPERYFKLRN